MERYNLLKLCSIRFTFCKVYFLDTIVDQRVAIKQFITAYDIKADKRLNKKETISNAY